MRAHLFQVTIPSQGIEEECVADNPEQAAEEVAERIDLEAMLEPVVVSVAAAGRAPTRYRVRAFPVFVYEATRIDGPGTDEEEEP